LSGVIRIPTDSSFTGSKVISANKTWILQLEYLQSFWALQTLVGGY
jgi:hypothetical protein